MARSGLAFIGIVACALASGVLDPRPVGAEPVDLRDPSPRVIRVEFEVSPSHLPSQTDVVYSESFPARIEPGRHPGEVRVIVPGPLVEQRLLARENPVPGSFSDFVWTLDAATGHVLSATLSGRVTRIIRFGLIASQASVALQVDMGTRERAGFRRATRLLGQLLFRHCADGSEGDCTLVEARPYDAATGYVNAVGRMHVRSSVMSLVNFSPLGEARFSELESRRALPQPGPLLQAALEPAAPVLPDVSARGGEALN